MIFEIKVKGELDQSWSQWLGDIDISNEPMGDKEIITTLSCDLVDQATLFGIIDRIRDLNLFLVSVKQLPDR